MTLFRPQDLIDYSAALLRAGGFSADHARQTADVLIWANARGTDSHGILRIPRYLEMIELGIIDPAAEPKIVREEGAVALLEAARAPGASAMVTAMDHAIDIAGRLGIGWCAARNITHSGAVGYYALRAAQRGQIGIVITASGPLMAYQGARVSGVSTNPVAIAAPSDGAPLLLDMSTSAVALGKIMAAKDAGTPIPEGWAIDSEGRPATDPADVSTLTPMGGPKGAGLSLMFEVLASVLAANPVITEAFSGRKGVMNGAALALNIGSFCDPKAFLMQVAELSGTLKGLPKAPATDEILMPGERGFRLAEERMSTGIPLAAGTISRLAAVAERLGVDQPEPLRARDDEIGDRAVV